jgi:hypothetical protein
VEGAASPFVLEVEAADEVWNFKLNGEPQPALTYVRTGDFSDPLVLQVYDLLNPKISLKRTTP